MRRPLLAALTGLAVAATTALAPAAASTAGPGPEPVASGLPVAELPTAPGDKVAPALTGAEGVVTAFVELSAPSALDVAVDGGDADAVGAATERIESLAEAVVPETATARLATPAPQRLSVTTNLVAGTVVRGDAEAVRALAERPEVVSVHRVTAKTVDHAATDVFTRARQAWQATGLTGAGMRVGVVDTGVDYTHATFGGPGTPEAYAAAYGVDGTGPVPAGSADPTVFLGGHDFAGPRYDAGGTVPGSSPVPTPDGNPIDAPAGAGGGHGTHVAGTAFGLGVTPDGATFRGDHGDVDGATPWTVGPGSAPGAGIYALKVFGDGGGSTHLTIDAMEWAADPDGGTPGSVLFAASPGTPVTVHRSAEPGTTAAPLLVLHTHNATPSARAQVVDVVAPLSTPTTTTLAVTGDRVAGADVTLTATVEPADAVGSVTFTDGGRELGTVAVTDGTATLAVPLGAGTRPLRAAFVPASVRWEPSGSAEVPVEVAQAAASVELRLTDRAIRFGEPTTAIVRVDAPGTPSGVVEVRAGERVLASGPVGSAGRGAVRLELPRDLHVGAHRLRAVYLGTADVAGATSAPLGLRVTPSRPFVTMATDSWTTDRASRPTVTVTVAGPDGGPDGGPAPTGTVSLMVNLRRVGTADLGPDGTAQFRLPRLTRAALVTAVYGGNAGYSPVVDMRTMRVR